MKTVIRTPTPVRFVSPFASIGRACPRLPLSDDVSASIDIEFRAPYPAWLTVARNA